MIIYVIGSGAAEGTPMKKLSPEKLPPYEQRKNSSYVYISKKGTNIVIDAGVNPYYFYPFDIDSLFITHWHSDHYAGLFPLRYYNGLTVYAPPGKLPFDGGLIEMNMKFIEPYKKLTIKDVSITPVLLKHSRKKVVYGYVVSDALNTVYHLSDTRGLPEETRKFLKELGEADAVIVDATFVGAAWGGKNGGNHNDLDCALRIGLEFGKQVWLTHIPPYSPSIREIHSRLREMGMKNVFVAYDGAVIQP